MNREKNLLDSCEGISDIKPISRVSIKSCRNMQKKYQRLKIKYMKKNIRKISLIKNKPLTIEKGQSKGPIKQNQGIINTKQ